MTVDLATIFLIAIGLSMDAFAVSIASGFAMGRLRLRGILRIALFFGSFQALMPVIGFFIGMSIRDYIEDFDHWVAFGLNDEARGVLRRGLFRVRNSACGA